MIKRTLIVFAGIAAFVFVPYYTAIITPRMHQNCCDGVWFINWCSGFCVLAAVFGVGVILSAIITYIKHG